MNATLSITANNIDSLMSVHSTSPFIESTKENSYATSPMVAVSTPDHSVDEEELYTSFELAMSERTSVLRGRLSYLSNPMLRTRSLSKNTSPITCPERANAMPLCNTAPLTNLHAEQDTSQHFSPFTKWQRCLRFLIIALMFTLLGFDLMGLLILSAR